MSNGVCAFSTSVTKPLRIKASLGRFSDNASGHAVNHWLRDDVLHKMNWELITLTQLYSYDWLCKI